MRIGLNAGYTGATVKFDIELIREADRLGYWAVWTAEAYGSDAITPLAWIAGQTTQIRLATGIMQMVGRTPAMSAMTAMTLDQLSGGRFVMGIGASGPQVVEGWHGVPYGNAVKRTREYIDICRAIWKREAPLVYSGPHYQIPYTGPGSTGLGKPLKSIVHQSRPIPIYIAAIAPKAVEQTAELADGWLPIFYSPFRAPKVYEDQLGRGFAKSGRSLKDLDIAAGVNVIVTDDIARARDAIKPSMALYIGGMGARGKNFYNDLACRYGFEGPAKRIQDLYLDGKKAEAAALVPDELVDEIALIGPKERIRDRLQAWKASPVGLMNVVTNSIDTLRLVAELQ